MHVLELLQLAAVAKHVVVTFIATLLDPAADTLSQFTL
jgi:hypothetical protein